MSDEDIVRKAPGLASKDRRNRLQAQADAMGLSELAGEVTRRCAALLNDCATDFQSLRTFLAQDHRDADPDDLQSARKRLPLAQESLKQLARSNGEVYTPIGQYEALTLLRTFPDKEYPYHCGTIGYVADTYAGEIKVMLDNALHTSKPIMTRKEWQHYDRIYGELYDMMIFAERFLGIIEKRIPEQSAQNAR